MSLVKRAQAISVIAGLVLLNSCTDFKGAADPYIYTPQFPSNYWQPKTPPSRFAFGLQKSDFVDVEQDDPLTLAEVVDIALLNNPTTENTWANARIRAAQYGQTLEDDFVLASGQSSATRFRQALFTGPMRTIVYDTLIAGDLNFSYLVFDFGQVRTTSKAALESLYNVDWTHNRSIQTVMQTVMYHYYEYLYQQERLEANRADVLDAQVTLDSVMEKLRNGLADIGEKVQAKTQLLQNQLNVVSQKQQVHTSYTQLTADMGIPSDLDITVESFPEKISTFTPDELENLINTAIEYRPDLLAAEADVKAGMLAVSAAKREYLPKLNSTLDIGRTYYSHAGRIDDYHFKAQAVLSFPIFQGFSIRNTVRQAQGLLEKAQAELHQVQLNLLQQVSNQRTDVVLAKEAFEYATEFLASAEEDFRLNLAKYRMGTGTITELLNAQTSVSDARARLALSKRDWFVSLANLAYALGTIAPPELNKGRQHETKHTWSPPYRA